VLSACLAACWGSDQITPCAVSVRACHVVVPGHPHVMSINLFFNHLDFLFFYSRFYVSTHAQLIDLHQVVAARQEVARPLVVHPPRLCGLAVLEVSVLEQALDAREADIAALDTRHCNAVGVLVVHGWSR